MDNALAAALRLAVPRFAKVFRLAVVLRLLWRAGED